MLVTLKLSGNNLLKAEVRALKQGDLVLKKQASGMADLRILGGHFPGWGLRNKWELCL